MPGLLWKICGMRDADNIGAAAAFRPDFMGFIFYSKSPRFVGTDFRIPPLPSGVHAVGVFVNEPLPQLMETAKRNNLRYLQLHGQESPEDCRRLQAQGYRVIKAIPSMMLQDMTLIADYAESVHFFLIDTVDKTFGGTGKRFDWSLLKRYTLSVPFWLSGGIDDTVLKEIAELQTPALVGIDFNSKIEITPGIKDIRKIKNISEKIRTL